MKLKNLDYLSNLLFDNYTLLQIVKSITINPFFIVLNICNMSNSDLLALKNDLFKYSSKSMVIKAKYIKILFFPVYMIVYSLYFRIFHLD